MNKSTRVFLTDGFQANPRANATTVTRGHQASASSSTSAASSSTAPSKLPNTTSVVQKPKAD